MKRENVTWITHTSLFFRINFGLRKSHDSEPKLASKELMLETELSRLILTSPTIQQYFFEINKEDPVKFTTEERRELVIFLQVDGRASHALKAKIDEAFINL
ncbi:hypothetical protein [Mucilaginibacter psychrotolerans]|uniref:Uncharacterized protein n=1 Tax=Mucilaginibacter psychrotolerans TaxID=1524096 RepID=A0A4Y8SJC5_9SPHI|nr:hypothetical protein [Mucilaginibacter psychrotolerans]TFF38506.1 hypothetical protein E2R66_08545 [Mucilaginibacter psychrotolerans]